MDRLIKNWHRAIVALAEKKLARALTEAEKLFVESRHAGIALEMIEDTVKNLDGQVLIDYLNSEVLKNTN